MKVKPGVELDGLHFMLWWALAVHDYLRQAYGLGEGTVTSALDSADSYGPARVAGTLHPRGRAVDVRSTDIPASQRAEYAGALQRALGGQFEVILEVDHIHIELQAPPLFA